MWGWTRPAQILRHHPTLNRLASLGCLDSSVRVAASTPVSVFARVVFPLKISVGRDVLRVEAKMDETELFKLTDGTTITELCVEALEGDDPAILDCANALLTLVRYHDRKAEL